MMRKSRTTGFTKRVILPIVLVAVATAGLAGCSSSSTPSGSSSSSTSKSGVVHVAFLGTKEESFQNAIFAGLTSVKGIKADFIEVGFDVNKQSQAVDDAVASGKYQGIVLEPNSPTGLIPSLNRAIAAGIQVINVEASLGSDITSNAVQLKGQAASIVDPFNKLSDVQTKLALKSCKADGIAVCNIARIGGLPQFGTEQIFKAETAKTIAAAGSSAKLAADVYAGGYAASDGLKAAQDLITAHPNVNVIMTADPLMQGVAQAVASSGKKITLVGIGGNAYGISQVASGAWYGDVAFFPLTAGKLAGETMLKHVANPKLAGQEISPSLPGVGPGFTKATLGSFKAEYAG